MPEEFGNIGRGHLKTPRVGGGVGVGPEVRRQLIPSTGVAPPSPESPPPHGAALTFEAVAQRAVPSVGGAGTIPSARAVAFDHHLRLRPPPGSGEAPPRRPPRWVWEIKPP